VADKAYSASLVSGVLSHSPLPTWLLRDQDDSFELQELIAHIRSGDYLITLATILDAISDTLSVENEAEGAVLQHLIENLIYIDKNYKLAKK